ncbi:TonB-dependent receptor [Hyalangium rubrum]|uniref:TonB-dependent receptor n=1 Tax=Hyalangium rubrum TaxID=3103134 RepID=A0ABU5GZB6_9BACT|nr:TonB-dependent receptor [Hyalangium sp. s54d21]MDY7225882.1 TonB-dependent receptor [Hyalangium sp. s54d21]
MKYGVRVLREIGVVLAVGLVFGSAAWAQSSSSVLAGRVSSAQTHQPLGDVVVTATSPQLQGEQTVLTDDQGQYRLPQLPPGVYTLRFDADGFQPFVRPDIALRLNQTLRVEVELLPGTLTEVIEVTATPPTIDVGSTTTGMNVDLEFTRRIALNRPGGRGGAARSFESLAELAPGAQIDQYGVSLNGATSPENGYVIDGLSTNDPAVGINATPLSVEFVQDVSVITGGYLPEFGRSTGGILSAVTRSGSNEFHGSVFGNWAPGSLEGSGRLVLNEGSVISATPQLKHLGDFGATLGGPILQDRLWFFAGIAPSLTRYDVLRGVNAFTLDEAGQIIRDEQGRAQVTPIPGASRSYFADARSLQYLGKLTYVLNPDHQVSVSLLGIPSRTGGLGKLSIDPRSGGLPTSRDVNAHPSAIGLTESRSDTTQVAVKYAGAFLDKSFLFDVNAGYFHQRASTLPADGSALGDLEGTGLSSLSRSTYVEPRSLLLFESPGEAAAFCQWTGTATNPADPCAVSNYDVGGPDLLQDATLERYQINAQATYLLKAGGTHILKAGLDSEFLTFEQTKGYGGGVRFQTMNLTGSIDPRTGEVIGSEGYSGDVYGWSEVRRFGYQTAPDTAVPLAFQQARTRSATVGGFVQDSWSPNDRLTLNLGVRYDVQALYGGEGQLALVLGNQLSPRLGAVLDPWANGRMKLFAHFARYYEQVPLNVMARYFPPERMYSVSRVASGQGQEGCDPSTREGQRNTCSGNSFIAGRGEEDLNPSRLYSGGKVENEPVDPDIRPQASDEYVLGGETELFARTRLGASYTRRTMSSVIEDMSRDGGYTYFLGNPNKGFAQDFPQAVRNYDAVTLYLSRTFAEGWLAQASYTWSRLYGNYPGLFRPETQQLDPNTLSDFDLIELLDNRTGLLPFDRTHAIKVFGAKEFVLTGALSTSIGLSYRGNSGMPINYLGAHPFYLQNESFVLPRGAGGRTPWVNTVDSNLGLNYRLSRDSVVSVTLDVFNLFNFQTATRVDESYTFESVYPLAGGTPADLPGQVRINTGSPAADEASPTYLSAEQVNPNFRQPTQYQAPRQFRLGVRYTF